MINKILNIKIRITKSAILLLFILPVLISCKKFLEEKPNKNLLIPEKLADFQALFDAYYKINNKDPYAGEVSADDYYVTDDDFLAGLPREEQNIYTWAKDSLFTVNATDWNDPYQVVYIANTALNGVDKIEQTPGNMAEWSNVKGQALFYRAKMFYQIATIWSKAYDSSTADQDLGIPLRLSINFNEKSVRASVKETYERIIKDLKGAIAMLPVLSTHVMRPSKTAAYAMLARIYLSMRDYDNAGIYADSCLNLNSTLLNYNTLDMSSASPILPFNPEVLYNSRMYYPSALYYGKVDPILYRSYDENDLRKTVFFLDNGDHTCSFKGSYDNGSFFTGMAVDEILLIRAETFARKGDVANSMRDLNMLLIKRFKTGTFVAVNASNPEDALNKVLTERRKELIYRGIRWSDLKRLNKEGRNITLKRIVNGRTFTLPPNDNRYALPIPEDVIRLSGMPQN